MTRIVIIGGGPAGYEAALVAAQLGAQVTVIERDGIGGASVLTDCVPSKTLIAAAGTMTSVRDSAVLGLQGAELATVEPRPRVGQPPGQGPGDGPVGRHPRPAAARGRADRRRAGPALRRDPRPGRAPGRGARRRRRRSPRSWRATSSSSPPAPTRGCCPAPSPTASGSSTGATSTTSRRCPSTSSSSAPASPAPSSPPATWRPACRSRSSPPATRCCPARTPTPPRCVEEVFQSRGGRIAERGRAAAVTRTEKGVRRRADRRPHRRGLARADDRRHRAEHRRAQPRAARGRGDAESGHIVVDRVSRTSVPGHLRRRRRHRRLPARLGRRHAGPHRHVARARRGGGADQAQDRRGQRLHPPRDRHRRRPGEVDARRRRTSTSSGCRWPPTPAPR